MKVYILTGEPFPHGMAATNRIKCYAKAIKNGGIDCEVIIYKRTEKYGKPALNVQGEGQVEGISFKYIGGTPLRNSNILIRQIEDRLDIFRTDRYFGKNLKKGDILLFYMGGSLDLMLRLMKTARNKGVYCVRDLCELPYGTGDETDKTLKMRKLTFERQFPLLDGVISISDTLMKLACKYTLPSCKHLKVPILVDYNQYYMTDKSYTSDFKYIFHSGTLYQQKDGILGIIKAFGLASQRLNMHVKFISTGNLNKSPHKEEINKLIDQYHLNDKILFTGYLNDEELKEYLSKASMVIINKYYNQQNLYCFSTKLGEYLAAAKPVIITNVGEAMNWLDNGKNAYVVEPNDTEALSEMILRIFNNPSEAYEIGQAGQKVCQQCFDYRNWSNRLVKFFYSLGS